MNDATDNQFAVARRRLVEVEAAVLQALASARASVTVLEEENRELRREALERRTDIYTEREFAALLKVSESTIARLRKKGKIAPLHVGTQIRYSSVHLAKVEDIFGPKSQARAGWRKAS